MQPPWCPKVTSTSGDDAAEEAGKEEALGGLPQLL
jgi:hypothetical protein